MVVSDLIIVSISVRAMVVVLVKMVLVVMVVGSITVTVLVDLVVMVHEAVFMLVNVLVIVVGIPGQHPAQAQAASMPLNNERINTKQVKSRLHDIIFKDNNTIVGKE